jgi:NhaP-type Na+/H+ or K+/H+ antiporter
VIDTIYSRFVLAAVSPAVVVPSLLNLSDRGYGLDKGIPTLVIAAASVDDVLAITGFGVVLGIAFTQGECKHLTEDCQRHSMRCLPFCFPVSFYTLKNTVSYYFIEF